GLRVALLPVVLRPFAQAGYTCWWVNRKRDMPPGYSIADMAEDHAVLIAEEPSPPSSERVAAPRLGRR
ncbi:MAG: hypothetical protein WCF04_01810, partial [Candidatus Nanopelagicales bacterium]